MELSEVRTNIFWRSKSFVAKFVYARRSPLKFTGMLLGGVRNANRVIIFMVPASEFLTGGILSIFNMYRYSVDLVSDQGTAVVMCTYPTEVCTRARYITFDNSVVIFPVEEVLKRVRSGANLLLHFPEYAAEYIVGRMGWNNLQRLSSRLAVHVNILNQNVLLMPSPEFLSGLKSVVSELTCTTAHPSYSTREYRDRLGIPCHHIPAWTRPDEAPATDFGSKRNLMLVSPDPSPHREGVLKLIAASFPEMEILVIKGMRFQDYLALERAAKWALTFGEGLDGYFCGITLRGGIGFAVFNKDFFTDEYRTLRTVYPTYDALFERIVDDIQVLERDEGLQKSYNSEARSLITKTWGSAKTRASLAAFYRGELTEP